MDQSEQIKVLLTGDVAKMLEEKEKTRDLDLCLLLCSFKDYEAFVKKDIFANLYPPQIKVIPPEPLFENLRKILKENAETLERK